MDGLLSPEDDFIQGVATGGSLLSDDPNFRRFTFLPLGYDASQAAGMDRVRSIRPAIPNALLGAFESANIPSQVMSGELQYGTPEFDEAAQQFSMDFGMFPAVGGALLAPAASNTLRMGAGGGQPKNVREIDDLGFYSEALEQAKMLPMKKGTGEQFRSMLVKRGVKEDEIKFTPELEYLLSQPRVTQEELVGLLEDNRIRPFQQQFFGNDPEFKGMNFPAEAEILDADTAYGYDYLTERGLEIAENAPEDAAEFLASQVTRRGGAFPEEDQIKVVTALKEDRLLDLNNRESELFIDNPDIYDAVSELEEAVYLLADEEYQFSPILRLQDPDTGYEIVGNDDMGYIIKNEGGDSLRGETYSLSEARIQAENDAIDRGLIGYGGGETRFLENTEDGGIDYRERLIQIPKFEGSTGDDFTYSAHFDEPNIAVHARTKSRDMVDGGRTLYVEELQSDWGQQGRDIGFDNPKDRAKYDRLKAQVKPFEDELERLTKEKNDFMVSAINSISDRIGGKRVHPSYFEFNNYYPEILSPDGKELLSRRELSAIFRGLNQVAETPSGEFVEINLSEIAPSTADRSLASINAEINYNRDVINKDLGNFKAELPEAPFVTGTDKFTKLGIKSLLKEAVDEGQDYLSFSNGDIQVGRWNDDGLAVYYDKIIPKVAKEVVKKLDPDAFIGIKDIKDVEDLGGNIGRGRFVIEITPKMKEAIKGGQPLFTAPAVPLSGILANDNQTQKQGLL